MPVYPQIKEQKGKREARTLVKREKHMEKKRRESKEGELTVNDKNSNEHGNTKDRKRIKCRRFDIFQSISRQFL